MYKFYLLAERGEQRNGIREDVTASAPCPASGNGDGNLVWREMVMKLLEGFSALRCPERALTWEQQQQ